MCGIAGIVSRSPSDLELQVEAMLEQERHRGPDDHGVWSDGLCALGQRRLAIIDLSPAGRNPMSNEDGSIWITFNGEIYNFQELRRELEGLGYRFRSRSDTETIVRAYEQWGIDCLRRLRGMFAFAIWDQRCRRLFLARDRVGKKPLFYTAAGDRFLFASELQALVAAPEIPLEANTSSIDLYLSWGYVPAPHTGFRNIFKLPPAHWLTLDLSRGEPVMKIERYWSLAYTPKLNISEQEAAEALREKLTEAVRLRLISDVPLGAFLSGGIDSSVVVGLMARLSDKPVRTFSIGFRETAYNELEYARRAARMSGTDHHEYVVEPDALSILPLLVRHYGEPYADSSAIPTFYLSKMTRSSVTVALNGDGGDESFAGYERYLGNRMAESLRVIPGSAMSARTLGRLLPEPLNPRNRVRKAKRFLLVAGRPMAQRYAHWVTFFDETQKGNLYSPALRACINGHKNGHRPGDWMREFFEDAKWLNPVDAAMSVDIRSYLPYDLLVKVDITSMANSLEARSPFLDHEVMEFAARLPVEFKLKGRESKYLLKRAFADLLSKPDANRQKMGFAVPIGEWFRGPLRPLLEDALLSQQAASRGYFQQDSVARLVSDHLNFRADNGFKLWNLMLLELWHREFLDRRIAY
jgi:asparagine synthase (glutamine-hydrolysing)